MQIDTTIKLGLSMIYFKRSELEFPNFDFISLKIVFYLNKVTNRTNSLINATFCSIAFGFLLYSIRDSIFHLRWARAFYHHCLVHVPFCLKS